MQLHKGVGSADPTQDLAGPSISPFGEREPSQIRCTVDLFEITVKIFCAAMVKM